MGWVFYSSKKNEVQKWVDNGCQPFEVAGDNGGEEKRGFEKILFTSSFKKPQETKTESKSDVQTRKVSLSPIRADADKISQLEAIVATLLTRVSSLENEVKLLKGDNQTQSLPKKPSEEYEFEEIEVEVEEEVQVPAKRLLLRR